ncbi:MAG: hypothetical protein ACXU82_03760 [Caulobacteraceae bacterium]
MSAFFAAASEFAGKIFAFMLRHWTWFAMAGLAAALWFAHHDLANTRADRDRWRTTAAQDLAWAKGWEDSFRKSDHLRGEERSQATDAIGEAEKICNARVAAARASAEAIQSITTQEPQYDQSHCPIRESVPAGRLRDALGLQAAPAR